MKNVKVEIVSPVHNRRELTLHFLRSISRIDRNNLDVHTIIVDDGSTDGTAEAIAKDFPDVEIIGGDGNLWYTGGTNRGIETALKHNPEYILCVNNDSILEGKCVRNLIECAKKYPHSVVGATLLSWNTPHKLFQVSPEWQTKLGGWHHWYQQTIWTIPTKPWKVDIIVGNCVLFPVQAIREVGLMDEKRFVQYGDAEYTPRMRRRGWQLLIEPRARVFCKPNDLPPKLREMPIKMMLRALFFEPQNVHSLRRRLNTNLFGAPTKLQGVAAFVIFFARLLARRNTESSAFGAREIEAPLAETFADKVIR